MSSPRTIVCCGPLSSGTRLLARIVRALCPDDEVIHRSMPHWESFWDFKEFPPETLFVIITRRPDVAVRSALAQGHGNPDIPGWEHIDFPFTLLDLEMWWRHAMSHLASIPHAYWMSYEALLANSRVQIHSLACWLDTGPYDLADIPEIEDRDAKWLIDVPRWLGECSEVEEEEV